MDTDKWSWLFSGNVISNERLSGIIETVKTVFHYPGIWLAHDLKGCVKMDFQELNLC